MDKLRLTIEKFELTIDIEGLIEETDKDGSGLIGMCVCPPSLPPSLPALLSPFSLSFLSLSLSLLCPNMRFFGLNRLRGIQSDALLGSVKS